jgi:hypothetical protein
MNAVVRRLDLMAFADECNRNAGFECVPEGDRKGRMMFLRQYDRQGGACAICGEWFPPAAMTRDHIVPRAKGGGTQWNNIQLACRPCNMGKGDDTPNNAVRGAAEPRTLDGLVGSSESKGGSHV